MKRPAIAAIAAGAAMMIGGALGAVTGSDSPKPAPAVIGDTANPTIAGQAMLPSRTLTENLAASPDHNQLLAALKSAGVAGAMRADGQFTLFAPANAALPPELVSRDKAQLSRRMAYLVVPGKYDSQALLKAISEGGGEARLRTLEGGTLVARMNGPTNIVLVDQGGDTANITIYDVYSRNGVLHVVDRMPQPGAPARALAANDRR